jgi:hypothetical protein
LKGLNVYVTSASNLQDKTSLQQTKARLVDTEKKLKNMEWDQEILEQKFGQVRQTRAAVLAIFIMGFRTRRLSFDAPRHYQRSKKRRGGSQSRPQLGLNWALRAARSVN